MIRAAEVKVGALVIISLVLLGAVTYYVLGRAESGSHYPIFVVFDQAVIESGDRVRLAGIDVGFVEGADLTDDLRARLRLMIRRGVDVYPGFEVTVSTSAVFGERFVNITPSAQARTGRPLRSGEQMEGVIKPGLEDLMASADTLIARLQDTAGSLNELLGDETISGSVRSALASADEVVARALAAVDGLAAMTSDNRPRVDQLVGNLMEASEQLRGLAEEIVPQIEEAGLPEHIGEAARSLRNTAAAVEDTADGVRDIFQDPAMRETMTEMLDSLKGAAARVETAAGHVESAAANIEKASHGAEATMENIHSASRDVKEMTSTGAAAVRKATGGKPSLPSVRGAVDMQYLPRPGRWWTEANFDVLAGSSMLRLGATDIGEDTGLNLQVGRLTGDGTLRAGLMQSKPGIGYDRQAYGVGVSVELFDPNHLKGNLLLEHHLGGNLEGYSLVGGLRGAFDSEEETGALGVRLRR